MYGVKFPYIFLISSVLNNVLILHSSAQFTIVGVTKNVFFCFCLFCNPILIEVQGCFSFPSCLQPLTDYFFINVLH